MSLETVETLYTFGPARLRRAGDSSPTTVTSHPDVPYDMLLLLLTSNLDPQLFESPHPQTTTRVACAAALGTASGWCWCRCLLALFVSFRSAQPRR